MNTTKITENYSADFLWNDDVSFAKIYFLESVSPKVYREVGTVLAYFDKGDAELLSPHWQGECYLSTSHFSDELVDAVFNFLLENTKCKSPFLLQVNKGERTNGTFRQLGNVTQPE